jgi:molecular chaperone DnaK
MAADNKLLGQFDLIGIPPAPRGLPQVEVTFDIDANGIVHVHAKDLGTGKEQSIKITASSGLAEEEIKRMVKDAELHAADDHKRREAAEARNQLDSLIYQTEKSLTEHGGNLDAASKSSLEEALTAAKKELEGEDAAAMKAASERLTQAAHKLAEAMYSKARQPGSGGPEASQNGEGPGAAQKPSGGKDDAVDADFEEVKG